MASATTKSQLRRGFGGVSHDEISRSLNCNTEHLGRRDVKDLAQLPRNLQRRFTTVVDIIADPARADPDLFCQLLCSQSHNHRGADITDYQLFKQNSPSEIRGAVYVILLYSSTLRATHHYCLTEENG